MEALIPHKKGCLLDCFDWESNCRAAHVRLCLLDGSVAYNASAKKSL